MKVHHSEKEYNIIDKLKFKIVKKIKTKTKKESAVASLDNNNVLCNFVVRSSKIMSINYYGICLLADD